MPATKPDRGRTSNVVPLITILVGLTTLGGFLKQHADSQDEQHHAEIAAVMSSIVELKEIISHHIALRGHPALEMSLQEVETQFKGVRELRDLDKEHSDRRIAKAETWIRQQDSCVTESNAAQWERIKALERLVTLMWARINNGEQLPELIQGINDAKGSR